VSDSLKSMEDDGPSRQAPHASIGAEERVGAPGSEGVIHAPPVRSGLTPDARRIGLLAALLVAPATVFAGSVGGSGAALGAFGGGLLAVVNFLALSRMVVALTGSEPAGLATALLALLSKLALVGGTLAVLVLGLGLDGLGVLLGVSVVFGAVLLDFWVGQLR
jgi:hypothetical protein